MNSHPSNSHPSNSQLSKNTPRKNLTPSTKLGVFEKTPRKRAQRNCPHRPPSPIDCVEATIAESIKFLTNLDAQCKPPDLTVDEYPPPPTDHAKLDQLLINFRKSLRSLPRSTPPPPPPPLSTLNTQLSTAQKKVPGAIPVATREPTPGTLALRTLASPERCISATFPPLCGTSPTRGAAEMPIISSQQHVSSTRRNPTS